MPVRLRRFVAADWLHLVQGGPPVGWGRSEALWRLLQAGREWSRARSRWAAEHGWPDGPVDRLREELRVRRSLLTFTTTDEEGERG
ncbi:MAG: hypothetical protein M3P96_05470 [Actinomycetota bacterium]|nr:hypothetical protein [Actinomycetota bacterium]